MPTLDFNGTPLEVNEEGFLVNPAQWNRNVAQFLAKDQEGLDELNDDHWAVIQYIRDFYEQNQIAPMVRKICQHTGLKLKYIYELFPSGPAKGAAKLSGLPKPDGCV